VKSRSLQWAEHVARMGGTWNACRILDGNFLENVYLEHREGHEMVPLRCILRKKWILSIVCR